MIKKSIFTAIWRAFFPKKWQQETQVSRQFFSRQFMMGKRRPLQFDHDRYDQLFGKEEKDDKQ